MKKTVIRNLFSIDQHVELYLEIVESNLDYPPDVKKRYIRALKREIVKYLRKNPDAVMTDVCQMFGDPYEQNAFVYGMIQKWHARELRIRTVIFTAIIAVLVVLLMLSLFLMIHYSSFNEEYIHVSNVYM